ncbi:MAG: CDGSH iron-sulfur domain-containing protein [Jatrophihabitans sp.]|uniref:CDGSH iron-sulfur domain-containing protein n=1 Tax=Jatrophihabitans sp. TaxID=1932789 RepID=UPI003F81A07D
MSDEQHLPGVRVSADGPYLVRDTPLVRRREVHSEHGEPLTWQTTDRIETRDVYALCRCGHSANKPFCDGTHSRIGFDGTETAPTTTYAERSSTMEGTGITVADDRSLCEHAGFCGNRLTNVWDMMDGSATDDTTVRAQVMAMVERCPSGALTYRLTPDGEDVEPDLRPAVGVVEDGPLWVTGGVRIERSDGTVLETRNRVTLCRCGASKNKPLCDGSHKDVGFTDRPA